MAAISCTTTAWTATAGSPPCPNLPSAVGSDGRQAPRGPPETQRAAASRQRSRRCDKGNESDWCDCRVGWICSTSSILQVCNPRLASTSCQRTFGDARDWTPGQKDPRLDRDMEFISLDDSVTIHFVTCASCHRLFCYSAVVLRGPSIPRQRLHSMVGTNGPPGPPPPRPRPRPSLGPQVCFALPTAELPPSRCQAGGFRNCS